MVNGNILTCSNYIKESSIFADNKLPKAKKTINKNILSIIDTSF